MADTTQTSQSGSKVIIPKELREKHPQLIELILGSESMNDEERQYWVNILPIMTPEQVDNLREILNNEKKQLAAIDAKYSKEIERIGQAQLVKRMEKERKGRREKRAQTEKKALEHDAEKAEELLRMIEER